MISNVTLGTDELDRALRFYEPVMAALGLERRDQPTAGGREWAYWGRPSGGRPLFIVTRPQDGQASTAGNGAMVALLAPSRAGVDQAYRVALAAGGADEGPPGLRTEYHPLFYGAYVRDPDGNKICFCFHDA